MRLSRGERRAIEQLLREVEDYKPLSPEEERELIKRAKAGDREARAKIVYSFLRFVVKFVSKYADYGVPIEDLINEANLGILKAIDHFDLNRGVRFLSYAVWWIRQAVFKALNNYSSIVKVSPERRAKLKRILDAEREALQETGEAPSVYEIAEELGISPDEVVEAQLMARRDVSLDMPVGEEGDTTLGELIEQVALPSPEESYEELELREIVARSLHDLDPRERSILVHYFGLEGQEPKTLEEIGQIFGISRERVRQLKERAIRKLKELHAEEFKDFLE